MATFVGTSQTIDKMRDLVQDDNRNRLVAMENISHDNLLDEPQWRTTQMRTYDNLVQTTNEVDLGYLLSQENEKGQKYYEDIALKGIQLLNTVTTYVNARVIAASLAFYEIEYLIKKFAVLVKDYRSRFGKKIDKDLFVAFIKKSFSARSNENFRTMNTFRLPNTIQQQQQQQQQPNTNTLPPPDDEMSVSDDEEFFDLGNTQPLDTTNNAGYTYNVWQPQNSVSLTVGANEMPANVSYNIKEEEQDVKEAINQANITSRLQAEKDNIIRNNVEAENVFAGGANNPNNNNFMDYLLNFKQGKNPSVSQRTELPKSAFYNEELKYFSPIQVEGMVRDYDLLQSRRKTAPNENYNTDERRKRNISVLKRETPDVIEADTTTKRTRSGQSYGKGLQRIRKIIYGKGAGTYGEHKTSRIHRFYLDKYYVDMKKLSSNILCVKYSLNDAFIPHLKVQKISTAAKEVIEDILEKKYNSKVFAMLSEMDKRCVKRFINACKLEIEVDTNLDKEFQQTFEILMGEYQGGNDSPQVKKELKKYILEALQENKIPKSQAMLLLYELSL